jgi:uncharacterized protein
MLSAETLGRVREIAQLACVGADPAHDFLHVLRVAASARRIGAAEGADLEVVLPAAWLHELFNYPKDHPESHRSGEVCAERARELLEREGMPPLLVEAVAYAIRLHPFSLGVVPATLEAKVLQDADRLDAIGAIGVARLFATGAAMGRPLYCADDPFCERRVPDDRRWSLDHFYRKLLVIPERLHTAAARALAEERARFLHAFLAQLSTELDSSSRIG